MQNDGPKQKLVLNGGPSPSPNLSLQYKKGSQSISPAVFSGEGYRTPKLATGDSVKFKAILKVSEGVTNGSSFSFSAIARAKEEIEVDIGAFLTQISA